MKLRQSVLQLTHNVGISTGFGFNWATQTLESHRESRETGSTLVWPCVETVLPKGVGTRDVASAPVTPRPPNGMHGHEPHAAGGHDGRPTMGARRVSLVEFRPIEDHKHGTLHQPVHR